MKETYTHDDSFLVFNHGKQVGEIDFRLIYRITSWGRPEQGPTYASGGEPAEGPEIEVVQVFMLHPYGGYNKPFQWLEEWVTDWAYATVDELVEQVGTELQARQEANADAAYDAARDREITARNS